MNAEDAVYSLAAWNRHETSAANLETTKAAALARATMESGDLSPLSLLAGLPASEVASGAPGLEKSNRIVGCDGEKSPGQSGATSPHSRRLGRWLFIIGALALSFSTTRAQNFSIDWHTLDGGGGSSVGGNFSLSGTLGQPDASPQPLTGGNFSLVGGFWSLYAVPTPGAPRLAVRRNAQPETFLVSWPSPSTGFVLQQNAGFDAANWSAVPGTVHDDGTNRFIVVPSSGHRFYRLIKP